MKKQCNYELCYLFSSEIKPPEKERPVFNSYKEKTENILLLAVKNQENDFLYTNSAKDKEKSSPAKLNVGIHVKFKNNNCKHFCKTYKKKSTNSTEF